MNSIPARVALLMLLAACAETNAPLPEPVETLLVVNRNAATLTMIPIMPAGPATEIALNAPPGSPTSLTARDSIAIVTLGAEDAMAVVDLRAGALLRTMSLPAGSGATGAA